MSAHDSTTALTPRYHCVVRALSELRDKGVWVGTAAAAAGAAAASYMAFEARWPECRCSDLEVPGLPASWAGVTILHLSDAHAGVFRSNEHTLAKVIAWAIPLAPDLVFLTGDILGDPQHSRRALELLARLRSPLGVFAVTGNHEYGLGKGPFAKARDVNRLYEGTGVTLLRDESAALPPRDGARLTIYGADYLSGGFELLEPGMKPGCLFASEGPRDQGDRESSGPADFPILLIHEPPPSDSPLAGRFPLAFAGHTHGGQLRIPTPSGLRPLVDEQRPPATVLSGVFRWGTGRLVISRGVGTSFLPLRLLTRPEATLWRLV